MNMIEATRAWLRNCPLIDQENRFNAGYLGAKTMEYSVSIASESHKEDILGYDCCTYTVAFFARMPFGEAIRDNISAADFFSELSSWIMKQHRLHNYPDVSGYEVTSVKTSNAGIITQADANTARYQIQIQFILEEVSYSDLYITVMYGTNGTVRIRAKRNNTYTVECPADSLTDTETYIFSASNLTKLGSLAKLKTKFVTLSRAEKLQELPIGSGDIGYRNLNMTELSLGNNTLIEYLDVRGLPNLTGAMDLSNLTSLEEFYGNGSGMTGLTFAQGAPLRIARVPSVASFVARDLTKLETFVMEGSNLLTLWVENSPAVDTLALCKAATKLSRGRLTGVNWSDENADVLTRLARLQTAGGIDAQGKTIDGFVLTGRAYCAVITQAEIDLITAAFPELTLTYGEIVTSYTVTFKNWDGTVLNTQSVRYGGAAVNPVYAGLIDVPTKTPTTYEVYTFAGWNSEFSSVTSDLIVTAVYTGSMRYYTVRFWLDDAESELLDTQSVPVMGAATYGGATPAKDGGAVWAGWDASFDEVSTDLDIHAIMVEPILPDVAAAGFDYLYSNDPADDSGYSAENFWGILYYGKARDYFAIGDRIKLACSTDKFTDTEIVLELRSFKHFESAERDGFAGPYFGMVGVMDATRGMNASATNTGGFPATAMFTALEDVYFAGLPQFWKSVIEKIQVLSSAGNQGTGIVVGETHLTLESQAELGFDAGNVPYKNEVAEGADEVIFNCYTDNNSRIKKKTNGTGAVSHYWLRSPLSSSGAQFSAVSTAGAATFAQAAYPYLVSFGFCLRANLTG